MGATWVRIPPGLQIFNNMEEKLQTQFDRVIVILQYLIKETENYNLTNEQWFLNRLDWINKLSVKY